MDIIHNLLNKYKRFLIAGEENKKLIKNLILKEIGLEIESDQIEIKANILYLKISPILKSELFLKQEQLILKLNQEFNFKINKIKLR